MPPKKHHNESEYYFTVQIPINSGSASGFTVKLQALTGTDEWPCERLHEDIMCHGQPQSDDDQSLLFWPWKAEMIGPVTAAPALSWPNVTFYFDFCQNTERYMYRSSLSLFMWSPFIISVEIFHILWVMCRMRLWLKSLQFQKYRGSNFPHLCLRWFLLHLDFEHNASFLGTAALKIRFLWNPTPGPFIHASQKYTCHLVISQHFIYSSEDWL